jgi:AraC-like DNA-binding protein
MIRVAELFSSELVSIERIDHPAGAPHVDPHEEVSRHYSINFLQAGHFGVTVGGRTWRVGSMQVFLTVPGQVHSFTHEERHTSPADVCVAVCYKDSVESGIGGLVAALRDRPPVLSMSNRRAYLRDRLFAHLTRLDDALAIEVMAGELLDASIEPDGGRLFKADQLSWYARRVDAARQSMDERYAANHSLTRLARDAGMSPYHFARVFRELAGIPPHQYLLRRRLRAAAAMLLEGAPITETCFAVGFRSLSHFIHTFRRAFGVAPSRFRSQG